jgi:cyclopropane-fatty-acyl-phospholipid synthase
MIPTSIAKKIFLRGLQSVHAGSLTLTAAGERHEFGDPHSSLRAVVEVQDPNFFVRALFGGNIGLGESWMEGEWISPDLVSVIRLAVRNLAGVNEDNRPLSAFARAFDAIRHKKRDNSLTGSRKNIQAHYDLSNDFFRLFLDRNLMYSCAQFRDERDTLEEAQLHKLETICEKLQLSPEDHILEIGTGWGGFAEFAARNYGCRVTTTTISEQQYKFARARLAGLPVEVLREDYRNLRGTFDKLVSIEMFEAVGLRHYDAFFQACDHLLKPDGVMFLQTITINEQAFQGYRRRSDWIQKYIFPGGELASVSEMLRSLARVTSLSLYHAEDIGTHYARTLALWRERFHASLAEVRRLGFDERFIRMWDYYLCYCEGAFLERHVGNCQLLLAKNHNPRLLHGEPWGARKAAETRMQSA